MIVPSRVIVRSVSVYRLSANPPRAGAGSFQCANAIAAGELSLDRLGAYAAWLGPLEIRFPLGEETIYFLSRNGSHRVGCGSWLATLMHTLLTTTLFYGYGFALSSAFSRVQLYGVVLAIWALQLWYSPLWIARFLKPPGSMQLAFECALLFGRVKYTRKPSSRFLRRLSERCGLPVVIFGDGLSIDMGDLPVGFQPPFWLCTFACIIMLAQKTGGC